MNKNMQTFKQMYEILSNTSENAAKLNNNRYTRFIDVLNKNVIPSNAKKIDGGFLIPGNYENINGKLRIPYNYEVKFHKLKDNCTPVPSVPSKINASTACGKVVVDVNGDKRPNPNAGGTAYTFPAPNSTRISDVFTIMITDSAAIPYGAVAQRTMFQND